MQEYEVTITEEVVETRTVKVRAASPQEAAIAAYDEWVVNGRCDEVFCDVKERTYTIDGEDYTLEQDN